MEKVTKKKIENLALEKGVISRVNVEQYHFNK